MAELDTLTTSSHTTHASRAVGASIIERSAFLRLCRNPEFITYVIVLMYSVTQVVPIIYIPHFHDDWRILQAIDVITAIPCAWGLIEMVAGRKLRHRVAGVITTAVILITPYVYFLIYGRRAPPGAWTAIALTFFGGISLEVFRYQRDRAVKKGLAEQLWACRCGCVQLALRVSEASAAREAWQPHYVRRRVSKPTPASFL